jgi:Retrotransposon gag protein
MAQPMDPDALRAAYELLQNQQNTLQNQNNALLQTLQQAQQAAELARAQALEAQAQAAAAHAAADNLPPGQAARLKPVKPESYSGSRKEDLDTFLFAVRQYCLQQNELSEARQVLFAGQMLKGSAALWWRTYLQQNVQQPASWDDFCAVIRRQFMPVDKVKIARDQIAVLRQDKGVREYTTRFRHLLLNIPTMGHEEQMDKYIRGLKPTIRRELELRLPLLEHAATIEDAINMAETIDAVEYRVFGNRPIIPNSNRVRPGRSYAQAARPQPVPMELGAIQRALPPRPRISPPKGKGSGSRSTFDPVQRGKDLISNACFVCHKTGHRAAECPDRPQRKSFSRPQPSKN